MYLYKRKGDQTDCNNHRGVSLLRIAGKILVRVIINRINTRAKNMNPESQCGFRKNGGAVDMIFAVRKLQ